MARTLLSGADIVYNGNPLNDLSLTAFLDKFMEEKPKQSTWHGGSQIEPTKKLDMNTHLIGPEILSLAEDDVPPEDLIFHKFYMNKMSTSAKLKKKKKAAAAAEEVEAKGLYGGDESDNEEIENLLDVTEPSLESDGEYDYDDLDNVADEDDDDHDLIGNASDNETEMDVLSDRGEADDDVPTFDDIDISDADDASDDNDDDIHIGGADDEDEGDDGVPTPKEGRKKSAKKSSASPFASLEEYEHLLNDEDSLDNDESGKKDNNARSHKKRKSVSPSTLDGENSKKAGRSPREI